jgi:hypothetical protein
MWIVKQRTLVHRQKVLPVVMQRNSLAISLKMMLETLGLDRQARPLPALADYLALPREAAAPQVGGNDGSAARSAAPAQDGDSGTPSAGDALPGVRATPGDQ